MQSSRLWGNKTIPPRKPLESQIKRQLFKQEAGAELGHGAFELGTFPGSQNVGPSVDVANVGWNCWNSARGILRDLDFFFNPKDTFPLLVNSRSYVLGQKNIERPLCDWLLFGKIPLCLSLAFLGKLRTETDEIAVCI